MNYEVAYCTDIGSRKAVNQDSLCIKQIQIQDENIILAVICDGMGGLAQGELASATVIRAFEQWFVDRFICLYKQGQLDSVREDWIKLLNDANEKILRYGKNRGVQLGTTATALLLFDDGRYLVIHVGDTRLYYINKEMVQQITEDQTYVAREIKLGRMTKEEAEQDARRNVLLQCIGAMEGLEPEIYEGLAERKGYMLLCSDGFRHKYQEEEMQKVLNGDIPSMNTETMYSFLRNATDVCMQRGEKDNISAILIKVD